MLGHWCRPVARWRQTWYSNPIYIVERERGLWLNGIKRGKLSFSLVPQLPRSVLFSFPQLPYSVLFVFLSTTSHCSFLFFPNYRSVFFSLSPQLYLIVFLSPFSQLPYSVLFSFFSTTLFFSLFPQLSCSVLFSLSFFFLNYFI